MHIAHESIASERVVVQQGMKKKNHKNRDVQEKEKRERVYRSCTQLIIPNWEVMAAGKGSNFANS